MRVSFVFWQWERYASRVFYNNLAVDSTLILLTTAGYLTVAVTETDADFRESGPGIDNSVKFAHAGLWIICGVRLTRQVCFALNSGWSTIYKRLRGREIKIPILKYYSTDIQSRWNLYRLVNVVVFLIALMLMNMSYDRESAAAVFMVITVSMSWGLILDHASVFLATGPVSTMQTHGNGPYQASI